MTTGIIPAANQAKPPVAPMFKLSWFDDKGIVTETGKQFLQQLYSFVVGMTRVIPCNCANAGNVYTLTVLTPSPLVTGYMDYDIYPFVASATSTGSVTGRVTTNSGALATVKFFKTNGSAQAGAGDVVSGSLYLATFVEALDGGIGGLVLK